MSGGRRAEPKLRSDEARQPEPRRVAPVPAFDDEDDDADLPPPVVRKPAARPVPSACVWEEEDYDEPVAAPVEEAPPCRCANLHR